MRNRSLYKFYSDRRWAEAFLEGELLFRSLAYFRDYEDRNVRGDRNEGTALFRPEGGLVINNQTQGTTVTLSRHGMESTANQEEIFAFCVSRSLTDELRARFEATVCVEILNLPVFCARIEAALPQASFCGRPGHTRIGRRVEYYKASEAGSPRWALPDRIATSKLNDYAWQDEFRLVFSLTNALGFQNVQMRLVPDGVTTPPNVAEHRSELVKAGRLGDICRLREYPAVR